MDCRRPSSSAAVSFASFEDNRTKDSTSDVGAPGIVVGFLWREAAAAHDHGDATWTCADVGAARSKRRSGVSLASLVFGRRRRAGLK